MFNIFIKPHLTLSHTLTPLPFFVLPNSFKTSSVGGDISRLFTLLCTKAIYNTHTHKHTNISIFQY